MKKALRPLRESGSRWAWIAAAWALVFLVRGEAAVVVNEIHFHARTDDPQEEYIELHNTGAGAVDLTGWRFTQGVRFTFPQVSLPAGGFAVVAANPERFRSLHAGVSVVATGWVGALSDRGETLTLEDASGVEQDSVRYATQGDWALRLPGALDEGFRGWEWINAADGGGFSLERIHPGRSGNVGFNWGPSAALHGTPGRTNSNFQTVAAPWIEGVEHQPPIPAARDLVWVRAKVTDDLPGALKVELGYRESGKAEFTRVAMGDDGQHGDGGVGDGIWGGRIPEFSEGTVVEYYVRAEDAAGLTRIWPAPVPPETVPRACALYQVDGRSSHAGLPTYRIVMTDADRRSLLAMDAQPWYASSSAELNATFICTENGEHQVRHRVGVRLRGATSRDVTPASRRVRFPDDSKWRNVRAINLNGVRPHSQVVGSALARLGGLAAGRSRLVDVRENGTSPEGEASPAPGLFAHNEAMNSEFLDGAFPGDASGALYTCQGSSLEWLGTDLARYREFDNYTRAAGPMADDWSDLLGLLDFLNRSSDSEYAAELERRIDVESFARYFALNWLLGDMETSLGTGANGEFLLYRGVVDSRFRLLPYDFDSVMGVEGLGASDPLVSTTQYRIPATYAHPKPVARLLRHPAAARRFHEELRRLAATTFSPEVVGQVVDQLVGAHVPPVVSQKMKQFARTRVEQLGAYWGRQNNTMEAPAPVVSGYFRTDSNRVAVKGMAVPLQVSRVRVGGNEANWDSLTGQWALDGLPLFPGLNSTRVEFLSAEGELVQSLPLVVWRDGQASKKLNGLISQDRVLRAADGPYEVDADLVVGAGVALRIEAGASVWVAPNVAITVLGRLEAEGTADRRIRFTKTPGSIGEWRGLRFGASEGVHRLSAVDVEYAQAYPLAFTNTVALLDSLEFPNQTQGLLYLENTSARVTRCRFPGVSFAEPVIGFGLPTNGFLVFEGNWFGRNTGYADVIDFTGGKRPGAILQVLNNVFEGTADDLLDLDGTDAHIEGNVFRGARRDGTNTSTSEAAAISGGQYGTATSEWVVVRNVFVGNDHDLLPKESAVVRAEHNTFLNTGIGSVATAEPQRLQEQPASRVELRDSIWWNVPTIMAHLELVNPEYFRTGKTYLSVSNSILTGTGFWDTGNNRSVDPRLVSPPEDWRLRADSPAVGAASDGLDLGAAVLGGAWIRNPPPSPTTARSFRLEVAGVGLMGYRYRLDGGEWSVAREMSEPIVLAELGLGERQVEVQGRNSAGDWQADMGQRISFAVAPSFGRVRLLRILANNQSAVSVDGRYPDVVVLHNPGDLEADLSNASLSDDPERPRRFVFPAGTRVGPGGLLTVYADRQAGAPGVRLGFGLDADGDRLFLWDAPARGGALLDSVEFGPQLADRAIERRGDGEWTLVAPRSEGVWVAVSLAHERAVRINELEARRGEGGDEFVELYNTSSLPVRLDTLWVVTAPGSKVRRKLSGPLGFLGGGQTRAFRRDATGDDLKWDADFGVALLEGALGEPIDQVAYVAQAVGVSWGRFPDGVGVFRPSLEAPSPGELNVRSVPGVLELRWNGVLDGSLEVVLLGVQAGRMYRLDSTETVAGARWVAEPAGQATSDRLIFRVAVGGGARFFRAVEIR